jgi:hypothetical protein
MLGFANQQEKIRGQAGIPGARALVAGEGRRAAGGGPVVAAGKGKKGGRAGGREGGESGGGQQVWVGDCSCRSPLVVVAQAQESSPSRRRPLGVCVCAGAFGTGQPKSTCLTLTPSLTNKLIYSGSWAHGPGWTLTGPDDDDLTGGLGTQNPQPNGTVAAAVTAMLHSFIQFGSSPVTALNGRFFSVL